MAKSRLLAWQLWIHYILLEILILFALLEIVLLTPAQMVALYLVIAVGDQAIHAMLGWLTGWKD